MVRIVIVLILLNGSVLFGQQNFINVPSGEVTEKRGVFFQQQFNVSNLLQSNTTLDYGLGHNWEAGFNVLGLNIKSNHFTVIQNDTDDVDPYNPLIMVNALKRFEISHRFTVSPGVQYGGNFTIGHRIMPCGLFYMNGAISDVLTEGSVLVSGVYYNTLHYGGSGNRIGGWLGCEIPVSQRCHLTGESIFGSNALSYSSVGVILYPHPHLPVTLGVQIPNVPKNTFGFVLEITWIP